jgi:[ribosomal protein S18]-alanine N-acetyltransferase
VTPTDLTIRLAAHADAVRIGEMSRAYIEQGLGWNWNARRVAHSIAQRETNVAVATVGDDMAGFGIMRYRDSDAHLMLFAVRPSYRRKSIGTALLQWLETAAITAGVELIWLEARASNTEALAFYRAGGYRLLDTMHRYYSGVEDAVRIGKDLTEAAPSSLQDR